MKSKLSLVLFCLLLTIKLCFGQTGNPILIDTAKTYSISEHGYFYEDKELKATIDSVIQLKNNQKLSKLTPGKVFSKGYTQSYYWIAFDVQNKLNAAVHLMFKEHSSSVNQLQLFKVDSTGKVTAMGLTGDHYKFSQRPFPNRAFIYPIVLAPNEKASFFLWADKRGQNMYMPLSLGRDVDIIQAEIPRYTIFGFYAGIFAFAVVFNLLLFISLRDKIHFYYAIYVLCTLIFILEEEGLAFQWFYSNFQHLQDYMRLIMASLSCGLLVQVMQLFVDQKKSNSKLFNFANYYKRFCWMMAIIPTLMFFKSTILLEKTVFYINNFLALLTVIILIICVIERIKDGYRLGWYYFAATIMLLLGVFNYVFNTLGLTNFNMFNPNGLVVGLTAEIIFLSFALTQRYNFLKKEKKILLEEKAKLEISLIDDVFAAQENERTRLARDLHDDLGGTLSAIKLNLSSFKASVATLGEKNQLFYDQTIGMIEKACVNLREIAHDLMPKSLEKIGLINALKEQFLSIEQSGSINFEFVSDLKKEIHPEFELAIYRVIKELINNVEKHACATEASLQLLSSGTQITIMCEDNGIGFDVNKEKKGLGLNNIYSRVNYLKGSVYIDSNKNGTTITIQIPN